MEMTAAKIGRSMKKCEIFISDLAAGAPRRARRRRADRALLRRHLLTRPRAQQPADDDLIVGGDAGADDAKIVVGDRAELDRLRHHRAVGRDREQHLHRLIGHHRGVGHQQRRPQLRHRHAHAAELVRRDEQIGIGEGGAHADRARGAVILIVDEVDGALQRPVLLVHQLALHLDRVVARRLDLALLHQALIGHAVAFADIEAEPDRIERDDGGEQRGRAADAADDQIADAHLVPAHAAGDRRRHPRVVEIELRLVDGGDRRVARGGGDVHLRHALVIGLLRGIVVLAQLRGALELRLGELELRFVLGQLRLGGLERELEGPRLDDEEKIALLDQLAVGEIDGFEIAAHPRAHLDRFPRLELAGEIAPLLHLLDQRLGHGDGRRRRRCRFRRAALPKSPIAIAEPGERNDQQQQDEARAGAHALLWPALPAWSAALLARGEPRPRPTPVRRRRDLPRDLCRRFGFASRPWPRLMPGYQGPSVPPAVCLQGRFPPDATPKPARERERQRF